MKHYIRLLTDIKLNEDQKHIWYRTVEKFLDNATPENLITDFSSTREETEGDEEFPYVYVVYVDDKIDLGTAELIVKLWDKIYPRDFEIESSAELDVCPDCEIEIDNNMFEEIKHRASKFLHNRWVEEKVQDGWRFGNYLNEEDKVTPRLRDWDSLNEQYRKPLNMSAKQAVTFLQKYPHLFV